MNIAIVGFATHFQLAPYDDPEWEIWGLNQLHTVAGDRRFDKWFNLHDLEKFHGSDLEHLQFLENFRGPVYLRPQDIGKLTTPNQAPFPYTELVDEFGSYFTNTVSWLIAYAITLKPDKIGVWGVDMAQDSILHAEYSRQRPSCEYFLGVAKGMGIEVVLPDVTDLLQSSHLYGFENDSPFVRKLTARLQELAGRKEEAKGKVAQMEGQIAALESDKLALNYAINQLDGAMQDIQYWLKNWVPQQEA